MRRRATEKTVLAACLLLLLSGCRLGTRDKALEVAKEIPQYPGSTYRGSFETGYPDDVPAAGLEYLSDDVPQDILSFYQEEVPKQDWTVTAVYDYADPAVPKRLVLERDEWKCSITIFDEEPRRINIRVERR